MTLEEISRILDSCTTDLPLVPPTLLYNEGWLLRLVLAWFSTHPVPGHSLHFAPQARWFSEGLLPSAFTARRRRDPLAESRTHVDGAIGHFQVGNLGKADVSLLPDATQFLALEAKLFSGLSSNVTHVAYFDQAARNVACVAELLRRSNRSPADMAQLGFFVLAPRSQIERGLFDDATSRESIGRKVERRVGEYGQDKAEWHATWFRPTLENIEVRLLSWEDLLATVDQHDPQAASAMGQFYAACLRFNARRAPARGSLPNSEPQRAPV